MLVLIGILIGLVLGLTGAGGSVFAVPLLILLGGLPMSEAVGLSLGAVAASTSYGSLRNWLQQQSTKQQSTKQQPTKQQPIQQKTIQQESSPALWKPGLILAGAGAVTAPLGKWLGLQLDQRWLVIGFCLLALVIAVRMWLSATRNPDQASIVRAGNFAQTPSPALLCNLSPSGQFELRLRCVSGLLIGGLLVGLLSGLLGVGGGFLIVPLLLALSAVSMAQAVNTSLLIIALISSSGFASHLLLSEQNHWSLLALAASGGVLGMVIGQAVSHKIANALLQKIFSISLIAVCVITLLRSFL